MAWAFWSKKVSNARFLSPKLAPDSDSDRVPESQRASSMEWLKAALRNWGDWNFATEMCSGNAMHWTREQLSRGSLSFVFARSTPVSEYPVSLKTHGVREAKRKINQIPILCNCLVVWSHDKWMCTLVDNRYDTDQLSTGPLLWLVPWKFVWPSMFPCKYVCHKYTNTNTQIQLWGPSMFRSKYVCKFRPHRNYSELCCKSNPSSSKQICPLSVLCDSCCTTMFALTCTCQLCTWALLSVVLSFINFSLQLSTSW